MLNRQLFRTAGMLFLFLSSLTYNGLAHAEDKKPAKNFIQFEQVYTLIKEGHFSKAVSESDKLATVHKQAIASSKNFNDARKNFMNYDVATAMKAYSLDELKAYKELFYLFQERLRLAGAVYKNDRTLSGITSRWHELIKMYLVAHKSGVSKRAGMIISDARKVLNSAGETTEATSLILEF